MLFLKLLKQLWAQSDRSAVARMCNAPDVK
jgi:hypothetical protein